jgi:hypothetical protein
MVYYKWQNETLVRGAGIDYEYENTVEEIIEGMERASRNSEVLVLYGHTITYDATPYGTPEEKLISILEAAQILNLVFYTISGLSHAITPTSPTPTPTGNGGWGMNDFMISIIISGVGIAVLWVVVSVLFRDDKSWRSDSI